MNDRSDLTQPVFVPMTKRFSTISLDELAARASLLTRVDRKYVVSASDLGALLAELEGKARVLEIDGEQHFEYESVYFDTPEAASFLLAAHPRRRRFKARTRSYMNSGDCYLEVKTKGSRGTTAKQRLPYDFEERAQLTDAGREYIDELLQDASVDGIDTATMAPVLTTRYTRTTLFLPVSGSRCTIDSSLAWLRSANELHLDDTVIVETKSSGQASEVDRILWRMGHRPDRISKFATGLAALKPDLPNNRWARVLRRYFAPALQAQSAVPAHAA